jgi:mannosyl-oligosaccharide glucosidase
MENIILGARERLTEGEGNQEEAMVKPYKYFTLSNSLTEEEGEVANFYVFQKVFKGEFQVCIASVILLQLSNSIMH